jgi:hypothetical protein
MGVVTELIEVLLIEALVELLVVTLEVLLVEALVEVALTVLD